jgi:hypothetical protein
MRTLLLSLSLLLISGCSMSAKEACHRWIDSEAIYSSYDRCFSCAKMHGTKDVNAVRSCAFEREIEDVRSGALGK